MKTVFIKECEPMLTKGSFSGELDLSEIEPCDLQESIAMKTKRKKGWKIKK